MIKKVLITGCNGFIGYNLVNYYNSLEYDVYGIDLFNNVVKDRCKFFECNMITEDVSSIYKEISPDIFIHCAGNANVGVSIQNPKFDYDSNVKVLYKTLASLEKEAINTKFIFLSSAAVYGNPMNLPITEEHELNPISPYGLHKKMCEDICTYYKNVKKIDASIVRIFSAYGAGLKKQIFWDMYKKYKTYGYIELFGTGNETRDFINIKDIVRAIDLIANSSSYKFIYNIANGEEISIKYLAQKYADVLGIERDKITFNNKVKKGDPINWKADISKLKELGYEKTINLKDGIKSYIDWVKMYDERT